MPQIGSTAVTAATAAQRRAAPCSRAGAPRRSRRGSRARSRPASGRRCRARPACRSRSSSSSATPSSRSCVEHRGAALAAGHEPDVADAGLERRPAGSRARRGRARRRPAPRSSADGTGDRHRRRDRRPRRARARAEPQQRRDDRRVAGDDHPRRRQERLEEHLDRAARQARVLDGDRAFVVGDLVTGRRGSGWVGFRRHVRRVLSSPRAVGQDPQQQRLAALDRLERVQAHAVLRADAADEPLDRSRPRARARRCPARALVGCSTRTTVAVTNAAALLGQLLRVGSRAGR